MSSNRPDVVNFTRLGGQSCLSPGEKSIQDRLKSQIQGIKSVYT